MQKGPTSASKGDPPWSTEGFLSWDCSTPPLGAAAAGCSLLGLLFPLRFHRLPEAVTFAIHLEDVATVRQPVEQGRRHPLPLEHLAPLAERQVAGQQQALPLIAIRKH